ITRINEQGDIFEIFEKYLHFCNGRLAGATLYDLNQSMRDFVFPFFKTKKACRNASLFVCALRNKL
ncbi:MAG: hypothetical protein IKM25_06400, partial [Clostridia bacterium]|nr:hypothetical protein [Clostridia bacterium]